VYNLFFNKNIDRLRVNIMKILRFKYYGNKITILVFKTVAICWLCQSCVWRYCIKDAIKIKKF